MSKFIKRHEEIAQARCQARRAARAGSSVGFTEAELEAAQWAKKLPEVQMQISRRTNGDLRGTRLKGIVATSRKPSAAEVKPASASLDLDEEFLTELAERKQREREREKKKERREERKQKKERKHKKEKERLEGKGEGNCVESAQGRSKDRNNERKEHQEKVAEEKTRPSTTAKVAEELPPPDLMDENQIDHPIFTEIRGKDEPEEKVKLYRKDKKEKKERKRERRERRERREKERQEEKERRERAGEKDPDDEPETGDSRSNKDARNREASAIAPEPGSLEAKALEMKMQRKMARQMRREQRQLKREEHERLRQEIAAADGWQDAIGQLIEAAQAQSREYAAAKAAMAATVIDVDDTADAAADPPTSDGPRPLRTLEQLVKELDELDRLKKEAKKGSKAKVAGGETAEAEAQGVEGGAETAPGEGEGAPPPQPVPNDPLNPLNAAYDMRAYALLRKLRLDEEHQISQIALDEPDWDHLGYLRRSPSPCRLRTNGAMWPTRKGAWRSRAGGVYLPPEANIERQGSPSLSPARWMYPEEFNRPLQKARRSPSYTRFDREEISSSSSSSSSSSTIPRRKKRRKASSASNSRASRPSPTYQPDE